MATGSNNPRPNPFFSDKIPFALAALFGIFAWCVTQIVNRVVESPTIEYRIATQHSVPTGPSQTTRMIVKLENLSSKKTFEDLKVVLRKVKSDDETILVSGSGNVIPTVPAWSGDWKVMESPDGFDFLIPVLLPKGKIELQMDYRGVVAPVFTARPNPKSMEPIHFTEPSPATFISRNETIILLVLGAFSFIGILVFTFFAALRYRKVEGPADPQNSTGSITPDSFRHS